MATIVNARDVELQATSPRMVDVTLGSNLLIPALKGVTLTAPINAFSVSTGGVASPTSITLTAVLRQITGTTTWSITGGAATLTGSGTTRTLSYSNVTTFPVTVRVSVTDSGTTYYSELMFIKINSGTSGTNGDRGSLTVFYTGSYVDGPTTSSLFTSISGSSEKILGDTVVFLDSTNGETRYYRQAFGGDTWVTAALYINGNAIINGSLSADAIYTGTLQGVTIKIGTSILTPGYGAFHVTSAGSVLVDDIFGGAASFENSGFLTPTPFPAVMAKSWDDSIAAVEGYANNTSGSSPSLAAKFHGDVEITGNVTVSGSTTSGSGGGFVLSGGFPGSASSVNTGARYYPDFSTTKTVSKFNAWRSNNTGSCTVSLKKNGAAWTSITITAGNYFATATPAVTIDPGDYITATLSASGAGSTDTNFEVTFS